MKTNKLRSGFAHILIPIVLVVVLLLATVLFLNAKNLKLTVIGNLQTSSPSVTVIPETSTLTDNYPSPTPGPKLTFVKQDLSIPNKRYSLDVTTLDYHSVEPVSCLSDGANQSVTSIDQLKVRVSDANVLKYANEIENYLYSDEQAVTSSEKTSIEHKGERSKREIVYYSICKRNNIYFFLYTGYSDKIHLGGGAGEPSYLAYNDGSGKLIIIENIHSMGTFIKASYKDSDLTITSDKNSAYYVCANTYAANDLEIILECGGGDGPAGAHGIYLFALDSKAKAELAFCFESGVSKYSTLCFNEKGDLYHSVINPDPAPNF